MSKDPVCGRSIAENTDCVYTYKDTEYSFCSQNCEDAFVLNPEKYINRARGPSQQTRKVAIIGAGQVGATFAFTLMESGLANSIALIDVNSELAEGHAMDLQHGRAFVPPVDIRAGDYSACQNADIVVVTAGAGQKPGETRLDLVQKNTEIFREMIPKITQYDPNVLLIVTNPVDILTYATLQFSGYPVHRVIGSGTVLDTSRFRSLLSQHCEVDARNVHAYVIGEHGDSEVAVWSQANIGGIAFDAYCPTCQKQCPPEEKEGLFQRVKEAAYDIIQRKGSTNFAVSLALLRIVGSILRDERSVLTVSTLLDGAYGLHDVCLSVPALLNRNGVSKTLALPLNDTERQQLQHSADTLKTVLANMALKQ